MQSKIPTRKQSPTLRGAKYPRASSSQLFAEQNTGAKAVPNPSRSKRPTREQSHTLRGAFLGIRRLRQRLKMRGERTVRNVGNLKIKTDERLGMSGTKNEKRVNGWECQELKKLKKEWASRY